MEERNAMKRKLVILITILLISTSLLSCKDPYEGAIVGAWQDSNRLVGVQFRDDGTCDVTFAREFITETIACAYSYADGMVVIYNPRLYSIEDFDMKNLYTTATDQGIVFSIDREKKDGVVNGFWISTLWMEKSSSVAVRSFSDWSNSLSAGGVSLNDAATSYTGSKFANDAIDWFQEALIE